MTHAFLFCAYHAVRVGVFFVTVELVNAAKTVILHVGPRLTNKQEDLSMRLVATKQVHQITIDTDLRRGNNKEREHGRTKDSYCGNSGYGGGNGTTVIGDGRTNDVVFAIAHK